MIKTCENGRQLLLVNSPFMNKTFQALLSDWCPFSILMTSSYAEELTELELKKLINDLVINGAMTFVCLGARSEMLHDTIDTILFDSEDSQLADEVITTYHPDEPISDVINFFVYGTETKKNVSGGLLAFLSTHDHDVLACIEDFCSD